MDVFTEQIKWLIDWLIQRSAVVQSLQCRWTPGPLSPDTELSSSDTTWRCRGHVTLCVGGLLQLSSSVIAVVKHGSWRVVVQRGLVEWVTVPAQRSPTTQVHNYISSRISSLIIHITLVITSRNVAVLSRLLTKDLECRARRCSLTSSQSEYTFRRQLITFFSRSLFQISYHNGLHLDF